VVLNVLLASGFSCGRLIKDLITWPSNWLLFNNNYKRPRKTSNVREGGREGGLKSTLIRPSLVLMRSAAHRG